MSYPNVAVIAESCSWRWSSGDLAAVDQLLAPPRIDHLRADIEVISDLSDGRPATTRSRTFRRNSAGKPGEHQSLRKLRGGSKWGCLST